MGEADSLIENVLPIFDRYRGRSYWQRILDHANEQSPVRHTHTCPECHELEVCWLACTLEPDLERRDGTPSGGYSACTRCNDMK